MKIATWNVNSVGARLPHLTRWLQEEAPHVVLLQEIKCISEAFPYEAIEDLGYNVVAFGQKSYNGVAIASKSPLEDVTMGLPTFKDDPQARYMEAVTNGVRVASIYVPNGAEVDSDKFAYKLSFYNALCAHASTSLALDEPLVWGGDYNVAPFPQDMHDPSLSGQERILCSPQEQRALRGLISQGFCDGLRQCYPSSTQEGQGLFSWWDYRAGSFARNRGFLIDHLLLSPQASDRLSGAGIHSQTRGWERPSDHAPVWITLE